MSIAPRRGLSPEFFSALQSGELAPIVERVRADRTLCLEIREDSINVYYRGGSLLKVERAGSKYMFGFDHNYFNASPTLTPPPSPVDAATWADAVPAFKNAMDLFFGRVPKDEREIQQHLLRDNNFGGVARSTDFYICDIEYRSKHGQFDAVGVHWPSSPQDRKRSEGRRLAFFEVKQGDGALDGDRTSDGKSGLHAHVRDVNSCLEGPGHLDAIKKEMLTIFNQKRALGLLDCGKDLGSFSDELPLLVLVLVNHDPGKTRLRELLQPVPDSPHADLRIAVGSLMGYGLYDQGVLSVAEALQQCGTRI